MDIISLAMAAKGGGGSSETFIGNVSETTEHLPSARPDGSALQSGDYIKVDSRATLPFTIDGIQFSTFKDKGVFIGGTWILNASPYQDTDETPLSDSAKESISGTAVTQQDTNIELVEEVKKIKPNAYKDIRFIKEYLYEVNYDILDYEYALDYFERSNDDVQVGACSSMRKGNKFGRNFDWLYDENAEFIVRTDAAQGRKAVIGVASALKLKNDFVKSKAYSDLYKIVPFCLVDGINEDGLAISVNVVPKEKGDNSLVKSLNSTETICAKMLPRYILDKFSTVSEAVEYLKTNVDIYPSPNLTGMGYETHYLLADNNSTVVMEFIDGRITAINVATGEGFENKQYMTNFHLSGTTLNDDGTVYTPEDEGHDPEAVNGITPHGCGLERYNLIANAWATESIENILNALTYTNAYKDSTVPFWYTEFVDGNIEVSSPVSDFTSVVAASQYAYQHRTRDEEALYYGTWHTTHSSVYDMSERMLTIKTQEENQSFNFRLNNNGIQLPDIYNLDENKEYILKVANKTLQWVEIDGDLLIANKET